ncbi:MAG: TrkH family potassium uptake protein [Acidobacteria bacterium]|nr:TrkH family potassium uptake protein [Acidobacteriota bacterium]
MIRARLICYSLGQCLLVLSGAFLIPFIYAAAVQDSGFVPLLIGNVSSAIVGLVLVFLGRKYERDITSREAFLLIFAAWLVISLFGAVPYYFTPHFDSFTDSIFESVSGFTTTGATVLPAVEVLPGSIQLWRHLTQWVGGAGVLLLVLAVLPIIGAGGMQLYRAEFEGARSENLRTRVHETATALWKIYLGLTVAEIVGLRLAGMSTLDAVCHALSTISTGGFSTRTSSIGAFNSVAVEIVITIFVLLSGLSFIQHFRLWTGRRWRAVLSDTEVRAYFAIAVAGTAVITSTLALMTTYGLSRSLRSAVFQVSSIMSNTGFFTTDFQLWPPVAQLTMMALMFIGGSTGSTAGGLKTSRIQLLGSVVNREFRQMTQRRAVVAVRVGTEVIEEKTIRGLLNLIYLAFVVNFVACLCLAALGIDFLGAIASVAACMFNVGPGAAVVIPVVAYAEMPDLAKWVLAICMIAGRVEFYAIFVIFSVSFWKR